MNLPNALTIVRFFLIPVYLYVFFKGHEQVAFLILVMAGLTDIFDGYWARKKNQITEVGIMLDPLADKTLMLAVVFSLLLSGTLPWIAAAAVIFRDVCMIVGSTIFHFRGKKTVPANAMGKVNTVLYYIAVMLLIFKINYAVEYLWFVIFFSYVTSISYIFKFKLLNAK